MIIWAVNWRLNWRKIAPKGAVRKSGYISEIELWIDLGQPDEKRIRKACGRAKQVIIYTYHDGKAKAWWEQQQTKLQRFNNLSVIHINAEGVEAMIKRSMTFQCNIQDGEMYLNDDNLNLTITQTKL